jgi:hypothetical protein
MDAKANDFYSRVLKIFEQQEIKNAMITALRVLTFKSLGGKSPNLYKSLKIDIPEPSEFSSLLYKFLIGNWLNLTIIHL